MNVIASSGTEDVAIVYILQMGNNRLVECVESLQPPLPRDQKWVLLVSTMYGCPVGCMMCDAGGYFQGKLSAEEILDQIDFLIRKRFPQGKISSGQVKIQFARMGEPALNPAVLAVLDELPSRYEIPGLMPSVSTIAPQGTQCFFEQLLEIKNKHYSGGRFQFQFSLHTTDTAMRDKLIPVKKWDFQQMAEYGGRFYKPGDRKITLNFALAQGLPLDPQVLLSYFSPDAFLIKITPLNPTYRALECKLTSYIDPNRPQAEYQLAADLQQAGYDVIISIGEVEENYIGSNCGQYVTRHMASQNPLAEGYTYQVEEHCPLA